MNSFPSKGTVERIKRQYPVGTKVRLVRMDDPQAPPIGTIGEIIGVDDIGSLIVKWSNGSSLNVVFGEDLIEKI